MLLGAVDEQHRTSYPQREHENKGMENKEAV